MSSMCLGRRDFLKIAGAGVAAMAMPALLKAEENKSCKPNIIIMLADDLGWNDVSYHGSEIRTPSIDRIAREGVQLDRFYVCPACTPTRVGLMTGRYPHRMGLRQGVISPWRKDGLDPQEETIAELLAKVGYKHRAVIGKWHLGHWDRKYHPLNQGFTHFYGHYNGAIDYFTHEREGEVDWHRNYETCDDKGYSTDLQADEAVRFIEQIPEDEPFFVYLPFNAPHAPLQAPRKYLDMYGFDESKGTYLSNRLDQQLKGMGNTVRQTYAAMVTCMDDGIGRILDTLDRKGIADNTLVLFFSDNGGLPLWGGSNLPLRGVKATVWEGGVRVPAVMRWPNGFKGGRKITEMMGYIDMMPTIRNIVAAAEKPPRLIDGVDMFDVIAKGQSAPKRAFYLGDGAVVSQSWKLIEGELYNLAEDPYETKNLAGQHRDVKKQLDFAKKTFESLRHQPKAYMEAFKPPPHWKIPD